MGSSFSRSNNKPQRRTSVEVQPIQERSRSFSIRPTDWAGKHYTEVVEFLRTKYPGAHVTLHAEKADAAHPADGFERPLSFEEGDAHIVIVYDAGTERIMGFYDGSNPVG
jgi:hypothetical protein